MSKTVLFVDSNVTDYQTLLASLADDIEVHVLNAGEDGVLQRVSFFYEELINVS
jgi:hypothetical protein